jgi:hypothetical protein
LRKIGTSLGSLLFITLITYMNSFSEFLSTYIDDYNCPTKWKHSQKDSIKEHEVKIKPLAFSSVFQPPTPRVHHLSFDGKYCTKNKKISIIEKKKGVL